MSTIPSYTQFESGTSGLAPPTTLPLTNTLPRLRSSPAKRNCDAQVSLSLSSQILRAHLLKHLFDRVVWLDKHGRVVSRLRERVLRLAPPHHLVVALRRRRLSIHLGLLLPALHEQGVKLLPDDKVAHAVLETGDLGATERGEVEERLEREVL